MADPELEPPLTDWTVTFEPEWPLGATFGLAVFGVDIYGLTVIPALESRWLQGFVLGAGRLGIDLLGPKGWGVELEPPW